MTMTRPVDNLFRSFLEELKHRCKFGTCQEFPNPDQLFEIVDRLPLSNYIQLIAWTTETTTIGNRIGCGIKLYRHTFYGTNIFIIVPYAFACCSHCSPSILFTDTLHMYRDEVNVEDLLERCLRATFDSFVFFDDYRQASTFIKDNSMGLPVQFYRNPQKAEKARLEKEEKKEKTRREREQMIRFGNGPVPTSFTLGDYLH